MSIGRILTTRKLAPEQEKQLINEGIEVVTASFIQIQNIDYKPPYPVENAIFSSKNAVIAVAAHARSITRAFCVGDKTEDALIENGIEVVEKAPTAKELAEKICAQYSHLAFVFFCGDIHHERLPLLLKKKNILLKKVIVYETQLTPVRVTEKYDAILFFSPSGVRSYAEKNSLEKELVFCIGTTTEKEAERYTQHIITGEIPNIESLIKKVIRYFRAASLDL